MEEKICNRCFTQKPETYFIRNKTLCKDCHNKTRRQRYKDVLNHREKLINMAIAFKRNKTIERQEVKQSKLNELNKQIGETNTICKYCEEVKPKTSFRKNRLKCKDCEREVPIEKFKRAIRSRIYHSLIRKKNHTIEYLGCTTSDYLQWISDNANDFTLDNHGDIWHIDHVIPLSRFNLQDNAEQLLAFNWRNTMALSKKENLAKNNKIDITQIHNHYNKLLEYHNKHNIIMPQEYNHLFAKHLVAGSPLEPI